MRLAQPGEQRLHEAPDEDQPKPGEPIGGDQSNDDTDAQTERDEATTATIEVWVEILEALQRPIP